MSLTYDTLGRLRDGGYGIAVYCEDKECRHSSDLDLGAAIARLGPDFVALGNPPPILSKLRCSKCGGKRLSLRISAPNGWNQKGRP